MLSSFLSNQSYQNTLHCLHAHIDMLNHSPVEHPCRNIPPTTCLLQGMETLENNSFTAGEPIFHIRERVTRIRGTHEGFSLVEQSAQKLWQSLLLFPGHFQAHRDQGPTATAPGSSPGWLPIPVLLRSHHRFYHLWVELRHIQYTHPFRSHDNTRHGGKCLPKLRNPRLSALLASIPFRTQLILGHNPIDRLDLNRPSDL